MRSVIGETFLIILLSVVVYLFEPQSGNVLAYYHTEIVQGEYWRLISATFCHTNFNHLLMNLAGLIITLALFIESFKTTKIFPIIIFNSLFISICLLLFDKEVLSYVGLSGVLHGLFSYAVANDIKHRSPWGYLLGSGLFIKITLEQMYGAQQSTMTLIEANVLVNAHLYGAIAGVCFYLTRLAFLKNTHHKHSPRYL